MMPAVPRHPRFQARMSRLFITKTPLADNDEYNSKKIK
jgi:hypothetical protein